MYHAHWTLILYRCDCVAPISNEAFGMGPNCVIKNSINWQVNVIYRNALSSGSVLEGLFLASLYYCWICIIDTSLNRPFVGLLGRGKSVIRMYMQHNHIVAFHDTMPLWLLYGMYHCVVGPSQLVDMVFEPSHTHTHTHTLQSAVTVLAVFDCFWLFLAVFGCFWLSLSVFGCHCLFLAVIVCFCFFWLLWAVLGCFDLFWAVLGCFGVFWAVSGCFGLFLAVLACFGTQ